MTRTLLVTGATGTVGSALRDELTERDAVVRAAARAPPGDGPADEWVAFDFAKPETWGAALEGVDALFLLRPPEMSQVGQAREFVDAAARVGVEHCAVLSVLGADRNPLLPHRRIERHVESSGLSYTHLRPSFFTQNLLEVHGDALARGEIAVPAGDGETSFVDARDVGAVAAAVLTEPGHEDAAYDLTGPDALTYDEVAAIASEVLDRPVEYTRPSLPAFVLGEVRRGRPLAFALVMSGIYTTARLGLAGRVTDDVARVLGREPRSVRAFFENYAAEFRGEAG
ncbi:SDR family oxidoreductase [Haloarcula nitratireducens]|uniref:SDR family oxidoreductase n=1 Tax=Haloarcula nitratireducens TaxID=2487749 RepID=A0AAW4P6L6_9EURY|nr:SDR family oxidoreductase [Halomicroarcula nitratireducens]MBX0293499.1 SDR family oxidoreductase [Halomicroarcula nitratireducens]